MPTLAHAQAEAVKSFFDRSHGELEHLLSETTSLLADLTDCAAVVVGPTPKSATVRSIQVVRVAQQTAVVVAVLSNGGVVKSTVDLPDDFTDDAISDACALLTRTHVGGPLKGAVFGPEVPDVIVRLAGAAMQALLDDGSQETDQVFVSGAVRMVNAFDAVDKVREVLSVLERQLVVVTLIRDVIDRGLSVAIGSETGVEPLAECSIVVAPYEVEGQQVGTS